MISRGPWNRGHVHSLDAKWTSSCKGECLSWKFCWWDWREGSVCKELAVQACRPGFGPPATTQKAWLGSNNPSTGKADVAGCLRLAGQLMGEVQFQWDCFKKRIWRGWREGGEKYCGCSSRESRFDSWHQHGVSQPSVTPVFGHLILFSDLHGHQGYRHTCKQNTIHIQFKKLRWRMRKKSYAGFWSTNLHIHAHREICGGISYNI